MENAEHVKVTTSVAIWLVTGGVSLLFGIILFWVKRWINVQDQQQDQWAREGGVITRERFERYCSQSRSKCPACASFDVLSEWRENIMEKGGPLARSEHTAICKEITTEVANHFTERVAELFRHHKEWVGQELRILAQEQSSMRDLIKTQMKTEAGRWDAHDERRGLPPTKQP